MDLKSNFRWSRYRYRGLYNLYCCWYAGPSFYLGGSGQPEPNLDVARNGNQALFFSSVVHHWRQWHHTAPAMRGQAAGVGVPARGLLLRIGTSLKVSTVDLCDGGWRLPEVLGHIPDEYEFSMAEWNNQKQLADKEREYLDYSKRPRRLL